MSPTIAFQVNPRLSLGFELNFGYGKTEINQAIPLGYLEIKSDGFGIGATIGLLYELTPSLSLGFNWRSPMKIPQEGDAHLDGEKDDLDLDLYWPQMISVGLAYKPNPKLTLGVTIKWSDWTYLDQSKFRFDDLDLLDGPLVKDSRDGMRFSIGLEYKYNKNIVLYTGHLYDQYSINSKWVSPILPDTNTHQVFAAIGFKWSKWRAAIFFAHVFVETRKNSESMVGYPEGEISGHVPGTGMEIRYQF